METYKVTFNDNEEGVFAISLVENPAIEVDFIALSSQEVVKLKEINAEQRIIISPVLIPDKPIYRVDENGNEFNIVFNAETIQKAQQYFYKNGYQNNSNLEHDDNLKLSGVTFVESWIKEDSVHDKSVKYGFDVPNGTWMAIMKVWDDNVWQKIKSGEVKGVSIEGGFGLEKINLNNMTFKEQLREVLVEFGLAKPQEEVAEVETTETEVKLGSMATADGALVLEFEGDTLDVGVAVFTTDADGVQQPVADGEYPLESGQVAVVAGGVVAELKEMQMEEETQADAPVEMADEKYTALEEKVNGLAEALESFKVSMSAQIAEGFVKLSTMEEKTEEIHLTKAQPETETRKYKYID